MTDSLELYGIACSDKFYRLAYFIGKALETELIKTTFINEFHSKFYVPFDIYYSDDDDFEYYLFEHKIEGQALFKKYKNINYYLLIRRKLLSEKKNQIQNFLNNIQIVIACLKINDNKDIVLINDLFSNY